MNRFLHDPEKRKFRRVVWAATRSVLETSNYKRKRSGRKSKSRWDLFKRLLHIFSFLLKLTGYYAKGYGNAKTICVNHIKLEFEHLPAAFDGYKILHLSDLHLDSIPGFSNIIIGKIADLKYDLCVMTGDYRMDTSGSFSRIIKPFAILSRRINAKDGTYAVLGNHDTYLMAEYEDKTHVELLINESVEIVKDNQKILLTGTDDPFRFFTEQAQLALETKGYDFKIALVHTSELYDVAANNQYSLYLCGHTHGGQICLENGKALISHQFEGKEFVSGLWKYKSMTGHTSPGVGVSGIPVRFNTMGEVTVIELVCRENNY